MYLSLFSTPKAPVQSVIANFPESTGEKIKNQKFKTMFASPDYPHKCNQTPIFLDGGKIRSKKTSFARQKNNIKIKMQKEKFG